MGADQSSRSRGHNAVHTELTDNELLAEFERVVAEARSANTKEIAAIRTEIGHIKQRLSRPPGAMGGPSENEPPYESLGRELMRQDAFQSYCRNPQPGGFRVQLNRPVLSTKATPIATIPGLVPPQYLPGGPTLRPRRRLVLRDIMTIFPLTSNTFIFLQENAPVPAVPPAAIQVNEGDTKVELSISTSAVTLTPMTIAAWVTCSRQIFDDAHWMLQWIDERLVYEVSLCEELEWINGDGSTGHVKGFLASATPYDTTRTQTGDTNLDILSHAETQLREADVYPTAFVCHPHDAEKLRLIKTSFGSYILDPTAQEGEVSQLWGLTPLVTASIPKGRFLVGDFSASSCQTVEREIAIIQVSYEHADYFVRNLVALRAEERATLAIYKPWGFVKGAVTLAAAAYGSAAAKK
jgi:HK97 family phage major capsid protein